MLPLIWCVSRTEHTNQIGKFHLKIRQHHLSFHWVSEFDWPYRDEDKSTQQTNFNGMNSLCRNRNWLVYVCLSGVSVALLSICVCVHYTNASLHRKIRIDNKQINSEMGCDARIKQNRQRTRRSRYSLATEWNGCCFLLARKRVYPK